MNKFILQLELVPASAFYKNLRQILTKSQWNKVSTQVRSSGICQICQIKQSLLDAHEVWSYDDKTQIQKLVEIQALCKSCHGVKHFGLSQIQGKGEQALTHLMKINKINKSQAEKYIQQEFEIWAKRSKKTWTLDISHLDEIEESLINGIK